MAFVTKLDYSNNRQIKQFQLTDTQLSGATTFGIDDVLIPESFTGDTINIDALQFIKARGLILPDVLPEIVSGGTYQLLGRDIATGKVVEVTGLSGGTSGTTDNTDDYTTGSTFNTSNGLLEFTRQSGSTYNVNLDGRYLHLSAATSGTTDDYTTGSTFNTSNGLLEFTRQSGSTYNVNLDGRYLNSSGYTAASGLEAINEGNGIGWRLIGKDPADVGNNGYHAIDMGEYYGGAPTTEGALATHAFIGNGDSNSIRGTSYGGYILGGGANIITGASVGAGALGNFNTINDGYGALVAGVYNTVNTTNLGGGIMAWGHGNDVTGQWPLGAIGLALDVSSRNHLAVGVSNALYTGSTSAADRPIFTVGIGTHTTPTGKWVAVVRKTGFVVKYNGLLQGPSYGSGTQTGTATYSLAVDSSGNIIEEALAGSGSTPSLQAVTDVGNTTTLNIAAASFNDLELFAQTGNDVDNIGIGIDALRLNTGINSIAIGTNAAENNSGQRALAIGLNAMTDNTGNYVVGIGQSAARVNTGWNCVGIGDQALEFNTGGTVVGVGVGSLASNVGANAVGVGYQALQYNIGDSAVGVGKYALEDNLGANSVGIGENSLRLNEGDNNTAIGDQLLETFNDDVANLKNVAVAATDVDIALERITITAHGFGADNAYVLLKYSTTGTGIGGLSVNGVEQFQIIDANTIEFQGNLTSVGTDTHTFTPQFVYNNTTILGANAESTKSNQVVLGDTGVTEVTSANANFIGSTFNDLELFAQTAIDADNIGIGTNALASNTGTNSIAIGTSSLSNSTGGGSSVAIGHQSGDVNTGASVTFIGYRAGRLNTGTNVTFVGNLSGENNTGVFSQALGNNALQNNAGINTVGIGREALLGNQGDYVTGVGNQVGTWSVGDNTTLIGYKAGNHNQSNNNTIIGYQANAIFNDDAANLKNVAVAATDVDTGLNRITITAHGFGATSSYVNLKYTTTGTLIGGLSDSAIYSFEIIDANTIEFLTQNISSVGTDTHTFTPQFAYENTTVLGANTESTKDNQVILGDSNVTEVYTDGYIKTHEEVVVDTTTSYGFVLADRNSIVTLNNGAATTAILPAEASIDYPIGTKITIINLGAGVVTVSVTTDTINQNVGGLTMAQYDKRVATKVASATWILSY